MRLFKNKLIRGLKAGLTGLCLVGWLVSGTAGAPVGPDPADGDLGAAWAKLHDPQTPEQPHLG